MVLLRPFVRQEYVYYGKDKPEAFWVHFTGYRAEALLDAAGFAQNQILYAGVFSEYRDLFFQMIRELQVFRPAYEDLLPLLGTASAPGTPPPDRRPRGAAQDSEGDGKGHPLFSLMKIITGI